MRNRYLVCYDVSDEKRLRKMYETCRNFGSALQYSVFQCDLNESQKIVLLGKILQVMNEREDRVMFADLGPADGRAEEAIEWYGRRPGFTPRRAVVL